MEKIFFHIQFEYYLHIPHYDVNPDKHLQNKVQSFEKKPVNIKIKNDCLFLKSIHHLKPKCLEKPPEKLVMSIVFLYGVF